jgi:type I restriction enzyme, S subunit
MTEAGVIPSDWEAPSIADLASFTSGKGINVSMLHERSSDFPIPVFGGNGIAGYTGTALLTEPSIIVGRVGQKCGEVYVSDGPVWVTDNALYPKHIRKPINTEFFALALKAAGLNDLKNRNDLPLVTQSIVHALRVAWPPALSEQGVIARTLKDVDSLLDALEALIAKKRDLKQAAMQQLLTGETRLPGFTGKWENKQLGGLGIISGAGVDKKILPNEITIRLVNYMDVYKRNFIYSNKLGHVVTARPDQAARCNVRMGDVFFTPSSETPSDVAVSAIAMEDIPDAAYSYHVVRLRLEADWDLLFRAYVFKTKEFLDQAARASEGSGVRYVITQAKFRQLSVYFPPNKKEQAAIAAILSDMDAELAALEQRLAKTRDLKQAMMQELLTGKTRLVPAEVAHA